MDDAIGNALLTLTKEPLMEPDFQDRHCSNASPAFPATPGQGYAMPADGLRFGQTREVMMLCGVLSLLTAIWLVISAIHHIALAKLGQHV